VHVPVVPEVNATVGVADESVKPLGIVTVIVFDPACANAPAELVVKPTVHIDEALGTVDPGLNVADVAVVALAIVAVPRSTMAMTMAPAVNLLMRLMGLKPDESSCPTTE
jgi:hypothetical protein